MPDTRHDGDERGGVVVRERVRSGENRMQQQACRGKAKAQRAPAPGACALHRIGASHLLVMRTASPAARPPRLSGRVVWLYGFSNTFFELPRKVTAVVGISLGWVYRGNFLGALFRRSVSLSLGRWLGR